MNGKTAIEGLRSVGNGLQIDEPVRMKASSVTPPSAITCQGKTDQFIFKFRKP
jgi:predicted methyltransferase